jgi:uncharacterized protein (DUF302 family)
MNQATYSHSTTVDGDFQSIVEKTTATLKEQGFGILTTIDVKAKMKEKLDKDMDGYVILGACNPNLAYQALQAETEIGLMLPCNVIVYAKAGKTHVAAIRPSVAMSMIANPKLQCLAGEVEEKLKNVINAL